MQRQPSSDELPWSEVVWVGQSLTVVESVQKLPAGQTGQSVVLPVDSEYLPAAHVRHAESLVPPVEGLYLPAAHRMGLMLWSGQ
jgi:hypothetical protein